MPGVMTPGIVTPGIMASMSHPKMFDDHDPFLARVRTIALELPGTAEKVSHGRPTFFTKKVFCYYGGSVKPPDGGPHIRHDTSVLVLPDPAERPALVQDPRCFGPAYLGPYGWVGLDLDDDTNWIEVAELVETSFRLTAGKRLIAQLDRGG